MNVGRAGAANLDVIQEVEYVKQEAKIVYLLECLQKTAPPVCIFCEKKQVTPNAFRGRQRETEERGMEWERERGQYSTLPSIKHHNLNCESRSRQYSVDTRTTRSPSTRTCLSRTYPPTIRPRQPLNPITTF